MRLGAASIQVPREILPCLGNLRKAMQWLHQTCRRRLPKGERLAVKNLLVRPGSSDLQSVVWGMDDLQLCNVHECIYGEQRSGSISGEVYSSKDKGESFELHPGIDQVLNLANMNIDISGGSREIPRGDLFVLCVFVARCGGGTFA